MAWIELQGLKIIGDGLLGLADFMVRVAEVAPAGDEVRRKPQRGLVVCRGLRKIAADHAGIAEM